MDRERRGHPVRFWSVFASVVAAVAGGSGLWYWLASRPQPQYVEVTVSTPTPTPLRDEAVPDTLRLTFSGPVAPLEHIGHPVLEGLTVSPALAGEWKWESDSFLVFRPAADWPIGAEYTLRLDPRALRSDVRLAKYEFPLRSPVFSATITAFSFNDDPVDPLEKTVVATVEASHPIDKSEFERRIELRFRVDPVTSYEDASIRKLSFRVSYDERGGKAFIRSERIPLPDREGEVRLELAKGLRAAAGGPGSPEPLARTAHVPSVESYFRIARADGLFATNAAHEVERLISIQASAPMRQLDLSGQVELYLLPRGRPAIGDQPEKKKVRWRDPREIVPEVLARAERIEFEWVPSEREYMPTQTVRYRAPAQRQVYLRARAGLRSFGGYALARDFTAVLQVAPFPREVKILHDGSLLSLSGSRKLSVLTRNLPALQFEVSRLLPGTIPYLVALTSGSFQQPRSTSYAFNSDNIAEVLREERSLPPDDSGRTQYTSLDFTPLLAKGKSPQGLFWLRVNGWDPEKKQSLGVTDERIVLVTDLGLIVKRAIDGSHDAFVMSVRSGEPVAGARVELVGKNGLAVFSEPTDAQGRASFPGFEGLERERTPTVWLVQREGDVSFLPVGRNDRLLSLAGFDTGGAHTAPEQESFQGYLFSDRGIYRPGEEIHIAALAKRMDWKPLPAGLPLELVVLDPRGLEVRRQRLAFPPEGFEEFTLDLDPSSPTGRYQVGLRLVKKRESEVTLADTFVRVEEFQPDQLTIDATFSAPRSRGWLSPADLRGRIALRNLFGTPAVGNAVRGSLTLTPWYPSFPGFAEYHFFDPASAKRSYSENLGEATTDEHGVAELPFALERFDRATYNLRFVAEGFQKESGRSVAMDSTKLVSPLERLVAWKPDGPLGFVRAGSDRKVELIAVAPSLERVAASDLSLELVEITQVAVLTRQENGTYAYQSVRKEIPRAQEPLAIPPEGIERRLPTDSPGSFAWLLKDAGGTELNRIGFEVAGTGGKGRRSLERNAELAIKLDRADYAPGDEIELEVRAPYTGAGLVTIERDRVYAARWFRAESEISLQRIRVPEGIEGNAYVVVSFARSLDSDEIFVSPLSSGAAPFTLRREKRTHALALDVPEKVEAGARLRIGYDNPSPARVAIFAVDEGILQVARWSSPDPLGHLLRKRALEVSTAQILDLVLPEFELAQALSAPGGDTDGQLAGNLNPFKRKGLPPVAYWSGVFPAPAGRGELVYDLPDHFDGTVRVLAIAVSESAVGAAEKRTIVRGPFVIRPNAPYFAAPGDEFEVSALVANNLEGTEASLPVKVALATSGGLEVSGPRELPLEVAPGRDAPVKFRVRALPDLGAATLVFSAEAGERRRRSTLELSVRPGVAKQTSVASGLVPGGGSRELPRPRSLFAAQRDAQVMVSAAPLALARGLVAYLDEYPHPCTEQLVSQALPDLVLGVRQSFERDPVRMRARHARVLRALQARQDADGAFALWAPGGETSEFVTAYATHFLIESRERGFEVPAALLARALAHLEQSVHTPRSELGELRNQAYALYLLARSGRVPTRQLTALRAELDQRLGTRWQADLVAAWLAGTYALLHLDAEANGALRGLSVEADLPADYRNFLDPLAQRGALVYLLARHFPARARALPPTALLGIAQGLSGEAFNTLSSANVVLGLDALAALGADPETARVRLIAYGADGKTRELELSDELIRSARVPDDAARLELRAEGGQELYWQLVESGYDREPLAPRSEAGLDVAREIDGPDGAPVSEAALGDALEVRVRVRADSEYLDVAIVDLLPAGFEVDLGSGDLQARRSLATPRPTWSPAYVDVREDRVVFYGVASRDAREFVYRIKATQSGRFVQPGIAAEGLYERSARVVGKTTEIHVGE